MSAEVKQKLAAALEGLLEQRSISRITVSAIVAAGGLSRQSFYNNFRDVYDLLHWAHEDHLRHAIDLFWVNEDFCQAFGAALVSLRGHRGFYRNVVRVDNGAFFRDTFALQQAERCRRHIAQVTGREPDPQTDFFLRLYWYGTACMLTEWIAKGMPEEPAALALLFYRGLPEPLRQYWK